MLACSMGHSAYAQTLDHKKTVRRGDALMAVQATTVSKCVEGLDTSISSIPMPTEPQLMIGAVETRHRTNITKNGMPTWAIVVLQVSYEPTASQFLNIDILLNVTEEPTDCVWGEWERWSTCSDSCAARDGWGNQTRMREISTEAANDGVPCEAAEGSQTQSCSDECPGKNIQ